MLRRLDTGTIEEAIRRAELRTSGEIRVSVAGFFRGDASHLADRAFDRLGMTATRDHNAVLILIMPTRRQVVIRADVGIHDQAGESFWLAVAQALSRRFGGQEFTAGVVEAIDRIGAELANHFPPDPGGDVNELTNSVDVAGRRGP
ncbi:MAG: TPM domain-containing protein [Myxococcales bacterium]